MFLSEVNSYDPIMSRFCTCYDYSVVMMGIELWADWTIRIGIRAKPELEQKQISQDFSYELMNSLYEMCPCWMEDLPSHYTDIIMSAMASQITSLTIVYSTVYSRADQRKHQSSASLAFVWGIHRWPVNSPHKWPVTWKMFPFDGVIMCVKYVHGVWKISHLCLGSVVHPKKYGLNFVLLVVFCFSLVLASLTLIVQSYAQCDAVIKWSVFSKILTTWGCWVEKLIYHKTSNISHTSLGNKIVDHSDVVEASPVGAAPTTSSFSA